MSLLLQPQKPGEVNAITIYQEFMRGEKTTLTPSEKQMIWVKILNLEAMMANADSSLVEAIASDIDQLKELVK